MIGKRGNFLVMAPGTFQQLEVKYHFPFDLMKKKVLGFVSMEKLYILYEEGEKIVKTPFARNMKWFKAIVSEPEFAALRQIPPVYIG